MGGRFVFGAADTRNFSLPTCVLFGGVSRFFSVYGELELSLFDWVRIISRYWAIGFANAIVKVNINCGKIIVNEPKGNGFTGDTKFPGYNVLGLLIYVILLRNNNYIPNKSSINLP